MRGAGGFVQWEFALAAALPGGAALALPIANAPHRVFIDGVIDPVSSAGLPPVALTKEDRTWAMIIHLSGIVPVHLAFANIIIPLVLWLVKRETSAFVDDQGREAVNAQISYGIYIILAYLSIILLIGFVLAPLVHLAVIVVTILAAIAAHEGRAYRYPFIFRFF